jgi:hypothetical protein
MRLLCRTAACLAVSVFITRGLRGQVTTVDEIMSKVAAHQDQAEQFRTKYFYTQKSSDSGVARKRQAFAGRILRLQRCAYSRCDEERIGAIQRAEYRLEGQQTYKGRQIYRITFRPKKEFEGFDDAQTVWAGEVLVDKGELQPISVTTHMAKGLPFLVRTTLGTNVHELGFAVSYSRFEDGVYFPVSYGGEFDLKVVFFYKRENFPRKADGTC